MGPATALTVRGCGRTYEESDVTEGSTWKCIAGGCRRMRVERRYCLRHYREVSSSPVAKAPPQPAYAVLHPPPSAPRGFIFKPSPQFRAMIYERDGWLCWICKEAVDSSLHREDLMSATLDHVVPQSWTLFPDHSEQNLALAHRKCNSDRSDEGRFSRGSAMLSAPTSRGATPRG